jgi:hypothetical protein
MVSHFSYNHKKEGVAMQKTMTLSLLLFLSLHADIVMKQSKPKDDFVTIPEHPIHHPEKPLHNPPYYPPEYIPTGIIIETQSDCHQYIDMLHEKDAYIESLLSELAVLREKEQQRLSKRLKKEHEAELRKFKEHRQSINTKNSIIIKEKTAIIDKKNTKEHP